MLPSSKMNAFGMVTEVVHTGFCRWVRLKILSHRNRLLQVNQLVSFIAAQHLNV